MKTCKDLQPQASKFKKKFIHHHIPLSHAAVHFGYSIAHFCNLINGVSRLSPQAELKLQEFFDKLEAGGVS